MPSFLPDLLFIVYGFCLVIFLISAGHSLYYMLRIRWSDKITDIHHPVSRFPSVVIQLPLYNEPEVVIRLLEAVKKIRYPHDYLSVQILDDSSDETSTLIEQWLSNQSDYSRHFQHIRRSDRSGFKAGALKAGLEQTNADLVAIFDSDFVPPPDFLERTIPWFAEEETGFVQARWSFLNARENFLTEVQKVNLDTHFMVEQRGRFFSGSFLHFNGTAGIWRRSCILDAGNWSADTVTEDLDLSFRAQMNNWKAVFLPALECPSELPARVSDWKIQQYRWTKGAIQTAVKLNSQVGSRISDFKTRWLAWIHLNLNWMYPVVILCGILSLPMFLFKQSGEITATAFHWFSFSFLATLASLSLYFVISDKNQFSLLQRFIRFPLYLAVNIGISLNNAIAVFDGFFRKGGVFVRTPKAGLLKQKKGPRKFNGLFLASVELIFGLYAATGLFLSVKYLDFSILPVFLLYSTGFLFISFHTFRESGVIYDSRSGSIQH